MTNNTSVVTDFNTTLAQSLKSTGTETEITLASTTGISYPAILKIGTGSNSEWISFTGITGTTITGVERGLKKNATAIDDTDSTLQKNLPIGSVVIMVEHSLSINNKLEIDEDGTVSADVVFSGAIDHTGTVKCPRYASLAAIQSAIAVPTNGLSAYAIAEGAYYDSISGSWVERGGSGTTQNASTTVAGKVEQATAAETIAGTEAGATGAKLIATPKDISSTIQNSSWVYATTAVGTDAYAITLSPVISAYVAGQRFAFKADVANTGACTLNVNAKGAKAIKKLNNQDLEDDDIEIGQIVEVVYDGTNFQMVSPVATQMSTANSATLTDGSDADTLHNHAAVDEKFIVGNRGMDVVTGTQVVAHGLGRIPVLAEIFANASQGEYTTISNGYYDGTDNKCTYNYDNGSGSSDATASTSVSVYALVSAGNYNTATLAFDATNVTISWTKTGTPTGNLAFKIRVK